MCPTEPPVFSDLTCPPIKILPVLLTRRGSQPKILCSCDETQGFQQLASTIRVGEEKGRCIPRLLRNGNASGYGAFGSILQVLKVNTLGKSGARCKLEVSKKSTPHISKEDALEILFFSQLPGVLGCEPGLLAGQAKSW